MILNFSLPTVLPLGGILISLAVLLRYRFNTNLLKIIDIIIVSLLFIFVLVLLGIFLYNLLYPSYNNALALASIYWIGFIGIIVLFGLKFVLWLFRLKKYIFLNKIVIIILFFITLYLILHYGFYAVTDDMYLNYEMLNIFPIVHMVWGLWFITFSLFLIFQLKKSKYLIVPLVIFFSLANLLVGILRLDRYYEVLRNDNHKIYVEHYQFLWVRSYYFYYEVNALYSVYINYISEDENESSYELVGDQLILREFKSDPYELYEEKIIDLLLLVG